jgi:hypothetical protein
MLDHDQERVDLKKKMAALVLVALSEDLPMGAESAVPDFAAVSLRRFAKQVLMRRYLWSILFLPQLY